jgi:hypothetical protein
VLGSFQRRGRGALPDRLTRLGRRLGRFPRLGQRRYLRLGPVEELTKVGNPATPNEMSEAITSFFGFCRTSHGAAGRGLREALPSPGRQPAA